MLFSRACEHAVRAMLLLATLPDRQPVPVRNIAESLDIPAASLAKAAQVLTRSGLLVSRKGPGGGLVLGMPAADMTLLDVVRAVDGDHMSRECVIGIPGCSEETKHCPFHDQWGKIRGNVLKMLGERSIAQVAKQVKNRQHILARIADSPA